MIPIKNIIGHLKTIIIHKWWVFYYCCIFGIPFRGIMHDLSKFNPVEFFESCKFYQGGISSPIKKAKEVQGYSKAWMHHKGINKHHHEYWTDCYDEGTKALLMPFKYTLEMICDYLAASRTYNKNNFTYQTEIQWWNKKKEVAKMNESIKQYVSFVFYRLDLYGTTPYKTPWAFKKYLRGVYNKICLKQWF